VGDHELHQGALLGDRLRNIKGVKGNTARNLLLSLVLKK
jgi:hypothetical protein